MESRPAEIGAVTEAEPSQCCSVVANSYVSGRRGPWKWGRSWDDGNECY